VAPNVAGSIPVSHPTIPAKKDIERYRETARLHGNRKRVEWWLDMAARAHHEFMKDGEAAAAKKNQRRTQSGRADYDEETYRRSFEGSGS
jgi:hypothetical protein